MLVLPEVFERTWGISAPAFWPRATEAVRAEVPGFLFLAEVYWDLEWTLQQQGFDYTYDKRLYDRLEEGHARPVREHLSAGLDFQDRLARFLENHDEPRAAATFTPETHRAAAVITFLTPGLRFFHQGQREGKRVRIPVHLGRGPVECSKTGIAAFYDGLLECLKDPAFRDGDWQLLECRPAWDGNGTWDSFVAFSWTGPGDARRLVAVNYAAHQSQCYVAMPWPDLDGRTWRLQDLTGPAVYDREGGDLARQGLYLDMPAWGYHVFAVSRAALTRIPFQTRTLPSDEHPQIHLRRRTDLEGTRPTSRWCSAGRCISSGAGRAWPDDTLQLLHRRVLAMVLVAWVPLVLLSIVEGHAWGTSGHVAVALRRRAARPLSARAAAADPGRTHRPPADASRGGAVPGPRPDSRTRRGRSLTRPSPRPCACATRWPPRCC